MIWVLSDQVSRTAVADKPSATSMISFLALSSKDWHGAAAGRSLTGGRSLSWRAG